MNLDVLNKLSTDGLQKMKAHIETILAARLDTTPRVGRICTFNARGSMRTATIERILQKNVSVVETATSTQPGHRWRVNSVLLTVEPVERAKALPVASTKPKVPHKPASAAAGDTW